ncbi:MAG: redoxin domain-containing protein [Deltaproteobacteria bacterium]|nr:redoxin domain-containing protein [Deltaproteobacteria bacterium]MCL5277900.1 redoxin domain-containing protein [Deltaproteobacteria bacterium]
MSELKTRDEIMGILRPRWINSEPLIVSVGDDESNGSIYVINKSLKNKPMLIDFWEYTCINCIRMIPYVSEWHKRYADKGLVIIGVHTPEFSVTAGRENLEHAIRKLGITYPVVMDNDYGLWTAFHNKYWPRKLLFNSRLEVIHDHAGEGGYADFESKIQHALLESDPGVTLPGIMEPVRDSDVPGTRSYPVTPQQYFGFIRGKIGNAEGYNKDSEPVAYRVPERIEEDTVYLEGVWAATEESAIATALPSSIKLVYRAARMDAVMAAPEGHIIKVYARIDGEPVDRRSSGEDVLYDGAGSYVPVREPRLYNITKDQPYKKYTLTLSPDSIAIETFAITFVSSVEPN